MKTLSQIREEIDLNEVEDKKLTTLIRAGLFDIQKLPLLKRALSKDNTKMSPQERNSLLDLLDTLISHVTGSQQVYSKVRQNVMHEEEALEEAYEIAGELPMVLILKRRSIRVFPDKQRVALYWCDKLRTYISVPYSSVGVGYSPSVSVAEEVELEEEKIDEGIMPKKFVKEDDVKESKKETSSMWDDIDRGKESVRKADAKAAEKQKKSNLKLFDKIANKKIDENCDTNINQLKNIVKEGTKKLLKFQDGTQFECGTFTASAITEIYNSINDNNKAKMAAALDESKISFMKMADFALSKV